MDIDAARQSLDNALKRLVDSVIAGVKPKFIDMYLEKYERAHDRFMNEFSRP